MAIEANENNGELFDTDDGDQLSWEGGVDELPKAKWARNLVELIEVVEARYLRQGMSEAEAFRWSREAVLAEAEYFGGRQLYIPRGDDLHRALRDAEIYRRFTGLNLDELAAEYKLTPSQVYKINRVQRKLHMRRIQPQLFEEGGKDEN